MKQDNDESSRLRRELELARARIRELEAEADSTRLFRTILAALPETYLSIIERDFSVGFTSGGEFRSRGLRAHDYVGLTLEEVFGDHAAMVERQYRRAFAGEDVSFGLEIEGQHQHYHVVPLRGDDGRVDRLLAVVRNDTPRRERENVFETLFRKHDAVMLLIDVDTGRIEAANEAAARFYGYELDELRALGIHDINALDREAVDEHMRNAFDEEQNVFVFPHRLASGETRSVQVHSSPITLAGKRVLFSIIFDITESRKMEEELRYSESLFRKVFDLLPLGCGSRTSTEHSKQETQPESGFGAALLSSRAKSMACSRLGVCRRARKSTRRTGRSHTR